MTIYGHEVAAGYKEFRRIINGERIFVHSTEELEHWIEELSEKRGMDLGLSVYVFAGESDAEIIAGNFNIIFDAVYWDLDHKDKSIAHEDLKQIIAWGIKHGWKIRCRFSGSKGFHAYLDFSAYSTFNVKSLLAESTRQTIREIEATGHKMQSVDAGFFGDIRRIMRTSNTKNTKSGLYCIDLYPEEVLTMTTAEILELAKNPRERISRKTYQKENEISTHEWLRECELKVASKAPFRKRTDITGFPMCEGTRNALKGVGSGMRDYTLTGLIHFFKSHNFTEAQIIEALINWNKVNDPPMPEFLIRNKVSYHMTHQFSPCTFFAKIGLCKNCAVYKRIIGAD